MSKKSVRIGTKIKENLAEQASEMYQYMSEEERQNAFVELYVQLNYKTEYNRLLRDAQFGSKSEAMQLSMFNAADLNDETYMEQTDQQLLKILNDRIDELDCASEAAQIKKEELISQRDYLEKQSNVHNGKYLEHKAEAKAARKQKNDIRMDRVDEIEKHCVPEEDSICPVCHSSLETLSFKSRSKIYYHPAVIWCVREMYEVKRCPHRCMDDEDKEIIVRAMPNEPELIDKSPATESLVAGIVYEKLINGVPLYRQEKHFLFHGTKATRQWMCVIILKSYKIVQPLVQWQRKLLPKICRVILMDETKLKCLEIREVHKQSVMIVAVSGPHEKYKITNYYFSESKEQSFVSRVLGPAYDGALMSDGLVSYANYPTGVKLNCMAHARRKVRDAIKCREDYNNFCKLVRSNPSKEAQREYLEKYDSLAILLNAMQHFAILYRVESICGGDLETLARARKEISTPCFEELVDIMADIKSGFEGGTAGGKAGAYFMERVDKLRAYLSDPRFPIDNNAAERAVKTFVMSRRNFEFCQSVEGAEATSGYLELLETAKMNGLKPDAYLAYILHELKYYKDTEIPEEEFWRLAGFSKQLPPSLYMNAAPKVTIK